LGPEDELISGAAAKEREAETIGIRPEHIDVSTTQGAWQGKVGVAEHLGSDTFLHIHGIEGCDPLTVRVGGEVDVSHGDTVFLTPQLEHLHRFDAEGLRMA